MKRWIAFAASLYPRAWREQFADEFAALLDDVNPGWRVFANVLGGAIRMQFTTGANWIKLIAATALLGAIVAGAMSFTVAPHYVSSAVMSITPQPDPVRPTSPEALRQRAFNRVLEMQNEILSRTSLSMIVSDPKFDLYKTERRRKPIEDVIDDMRRDIRIRARQSAVSGLSPIVFDISFAYPDQARAQAVVRELATRFAAEHVRNNRSEASTYRSFWHDEAAANHTPPAPPPPVGETVAVIDPASLPKRSQGPDRIVFLAWGLGTGLLLGLVAALTMRWPRGVLQLSGFAAAGCLLAGAASFLIPNRFTSTAVMMMAPARIMEDPLAALPPATPATEFLSQIEPQVLSFDSLAAIIQNFRLDLYPRDRVTKPMEDIVRNMLARDLRITVLQPRNEATSAFMISFSYSDNHKAQQVVQTLITRFIDLNLAREKAKASQSVTLHEIVMRRADENLEVLDSPSFPVKPESPNRLTIAAAGFGIGIFLGAITLFLRRPRTPQTSVYACP